MFSAAVNLENQQKAICFLDRLMITIFPSSAFLTKSLRLGKLLPSVRMEPYLYGQTVEEIKRKQGEDNRLFRLIRQHGLAREFPPIISTIKAFSQGKAKIVSGKVVDIDGRIINGYNRTGERGNLIRRLEDLQVNDNTLSSR